jgi:hypothetical protein
MEREPKWFAYEPALTPSAKAAFRTFLARVGTTPHQELRSHVRAKVEATMRNGDLARVFAESLTLDLVEQGWVLSGANGKYRMRAPLPQDETTEAAKERVRRLHQLERDLYLQEPSVREFIASMEQRRLTPQGWHCIYSVMRDGRELAAQLREAATEPDLDRRAEKLASVVDPYVQFVEPGAVCSQTGLALGDIWRYFRLTWVNIPKSVPGRSLMILIRDRAAVNHPVIGIAALGSSVVQQEIRDRWIGWTAEAVLADLEAKPSAQAAKWLLETVDDMVDHVYVRDLVKDGVLSRGNLTRPTDLVIEGLRAEAARAKELHRLYPGALAHKRNEGEWDVQTQTHLFRSKRCEVLAKLLTIRRAFRDAGLTTGTKQELVEALTHGAVRHAVGQLVRLTKAAHVGIDMMDVTVCGAVAPYGHLLGGKLVCTLLLSPEVVRYYAQRYGAQESVIASSIRGAGVTRKPNLVLLCTTSLYGVGSSQYNRVKVPAAAVGGAEEDTLQYLELGHSKGYGSFHLSGQTLKLVNWLAGRQAQVEGRKVNSIFGEGVNPLMRKIREALEIVQLSGDDILNHGNRRVVYGIALASNFRDVLLGRAKAPKYYLPVKLGAEGTKRLAAFWRRRWLANRMERPEIIEAVGAHSLSYPVSHGARIQTPVVDDDQELLSL